MAKFLHCVPRGTQGKQKPQGPRVEDHLELKTLEGTSVALAAYPSYVLRTPREPTVVGIPEKENYVVSQRPPSPILVGLVLPISQPCGMIVQTANLVDT